MATLEEGTVKCPKSTAITSGTKRMRVDEELEELVSVSSASDNYDNEEEELQGRNKREDEDLSKKTDDQARKRKAQEPTHQRKQEDTTSATTFDTKTYSAKAEPGKTGKGTTSPPLTNRPSLKIPRPPRPRVNSALATKRSIQIVGQTQSGGYQICRILVVTPSPAVPATAVPTAADVQIQASDQPQQPTPQQTLPTIIKKLKPYRMRNGGYKLGMELRTCEWMTKEMREAFPGTDPCIAIVSVNRGLAKQVGFRPKDILCWPTPKKVTATNTGSTDVVHVNNATAEDGERAVLQEQDKQRSNGSSSSKTVWELMNGTQLKDSLDWLETKGCISFYVARKLSPADIAIANEMKKRTTAAAAAAAAKKNATTQKSRQSSSKTKRAFNHSSRREPSGATGGGNGNNNDNKAVSSSSGDEHGKPRIAPLPVHSVTRDHIRPNKDVVLGRPGNIGTGNGTFSVYQATLTAWWERYELASHTDKIEICKMTIADMLARGCRFLSRVDDGSRHGYYEVVPSTSESIRKKVLRALRQEVLQRIEHLSPDARLARQHDMEVKRNYNRLDEQQYQQQEQRDGHPTYATTNPATVLPAAAPTTSDFSPQIADVSAPAVVAPVATLVKKIVGASTGDDAVKDTDGGSVKQTDRGSVKETGDGSSAAGDCGTVKDEGVSPESGVSESADCSVEWL